MWNKCTGFLCLLLLLGACDPSPSNSNTKNYNKNPNFSIPPAPSFAKVEANELPFFQGSAFNPIWRKNKAVLPSGVLQIPDFNFLDQEGEAVNRATFEGKITVASFFFSGCSGYCPTIMRNLLDVQQTYLSDPSILLLSHSVTPDLDTPQQLQSYSQEVGAQTKKWFLVTGEREHIYDLARKSYYADTQLRESQTQNDFLHSESVYLLDLEQRIRGVYNGNSRSAIQKLKQDIQLLKQSTQAL